jgi:hypothetical protein
MNDSLLFRAFFPGPWPPLMVDRVVQRYETNWAREGRWGFIQQDRISLWTACGGHRHVPGRDPWKEPSTDMLVLFRWQVGQGGGGL